MHCTSMQFPSLLESLESHQLNLGLYTTRVTAENLHRAIAEAEGEAPSLTEVEVALRALVAQGEAIEWAPGLFRSRIAKTVRCLRLLRQRLWWQKDLSEARPLVEGIRVEFRQHRRPKRDAVSVSDAIPNEVPPEVVCAFQEAIGFPTFSGFRPAPSSASTPVPGRAIPITNPAIEGPGRPAR